MPYNPELHHRRSIRLKGYDYTEARAYFVTICTTQKQCLLGDVVEGDMALNGFGRIADTCWRALPEHFPQVELDAYIIMPNHVHGIIVIADGVGAQHAAPLRESHNMYGNTGKSNKVVPGSLGAIVRSFKSAVTKAVNEARRSPGRPFWQRNFYERVIRHEDELNGIRSYILNNPAKWAEDSENPNRL